MKPFWRWIFWTCWGTCLDLCLDWICFVFPKLYGVLSHPFALGKPELEWNIEIFLPLPCTPARLLHSSFSGKQQEGREQIVLSFIFWLRFLLPLLPWLLRKPHSHRSILKVYVFLAVVLSWDMGTHETRKQETCILFTEWMIISRIARAGSISRGGRASGRSIVMVAVGKLPSLISVHIGWQWKLEEFYE